MLSSRLEKIEMVTSPERGKTVKVGATETITHPEMSKTVKVGADGWICPKCGTKNKPTDITCIGCGKYR